MARKLKSQQQTLSGSPVGNFTNYSPAAIQANRAPTTADTGYAIGQLWADTNGTTMYGLSAVSAGSATWNLLGPGASDVDTLTGDGGGAISPAGGNITLAGGTNITTAGAGSTITFNLDAAITLATSVTSPLYTAAAAADVDITAPAGQDIVLKMGDAAGANKVSFTDSADVEVFAIDSNGTIAFTGISNTGAFTTAGGAASINASSNFNTVINSGTSTGTVTIGNGAAGAITIDSGAGISVDAATASNFTVTGASEDLTLASTGGSVNITATEAAADAIVMNASDGAGGVQIQAGTGGILVGNQADCTTIDVGDIAPTAARTITVGGGTVVTASVTDTIDIGPDGATTNADSVKTVNVNGGGVTTGQVLTNIATGAITSGTHTVSIQSGNAAAGTVATNISTGTGTKTVNVGNADASTTVNIDAVTLINDSVNANTSINTGTSTGTITIGNSAAGAIALDTDADFSINGDDASTISVTAGTLDIDASGDLSVNSSAGVINVGNDAVAQNINIGTGAAARTITVGNTTGATGLVLEAGTGEITVTGTVKEISAEFLEASGDEITSFSQSPILTTAANTAGVATGSNGDVNLMYCQQGVLMEQFIIGTQTIIGPRMDSNGLLVSLDLTNAEGAEYNFGAARTNSRHAFTIGTSAAFFFEVGLYINDMDGAAPYVIGFRKSEANNATMASYTDYAAIGMNAGSSVTNIVTMTELNSGGQTITDTTDAWGGDGSTNTLRVLVDASGNVTYTINGSAPSSSVAFQFDNTDVVVPYIHLLHNANATQVNITSLKVGFQA